MNEFEDIDRQLTDAFAQRPSTLSRPSLRDVEHRARRHQRQRSAGVLSACAVVAVGGAAVLATRSPQSATTVGGDAGDATTVPACYATTEPPVSTIGFASTIEVLESSTIPATTVFNTLPFPPDTGPATTLPPISEPTTYPTIPDPLSTVVAYPAPSVDPCSPQPPNRYRCTGDPVQGGDGWWYFDYCESNGAITNVPYTTTSVPFSGQVTKTGTSIQVVNCSYQDGVAGYLSDALVAEGFTMIKPDTGTINLPVTKVIYNPDDPAALAVAQTVALLLGNAVVEPSGPEVPSLTGAWAPGSSVIVLLGDDLVGKTLAQIAGGDTVTATTTVGP